MRPTLLVGDYVIVSKFSYGFSGHTLPWSLIPFRCRLFAAQPARGDVAVFRLPRDPRQIYIKRIIGLPGDRVQIRGSELWLNGRRVPIESLQEPMATSSQYLRHKNEGEQFYEFLSNSRTYRVFAPSGDGDRAFISTYIVPKGHYFMLGDNRGNSADSRFTSSEGGVGFVPFDHLLGRAEAIGFSIDYQRLNLSPLSWLNAFRWRRALSYVSGRRDRLAYDPDVWQSGVRETASFQG